MRRFLRFSGTMVVNNRMAFFSDVLGHSTLTGIAIGVVLGFVDPFLPMLLFAVLLAISVNVFRQLTKAAPDTVLGAFFSLGGSFRHCVVKPWRRFC